MKNNALKKHHFWLLFGAVPLLVGLLLILLLFGPAEATAENGDKYKKQFDAVGAAKAPGMGTLAELAKHKELLEERRTQLWGANYERQRTAGVYAWPTVGRGDPFLLALEKRDLRFGALEVRSLDATKPDDTQFVVLNDEMAKFTASSLYVESYSALAKSMLPTRFAGTGWTSVLRYVTDWGTGGRPESNAFWLALEDFWIQRALLKPVAEVNAAAARFEIVKPAADEKDTPLKRRFQNRTWEIEIEVVNGVLKSKIRNKTDRLQMLGLNKTMTLKVWLDDPKLGTAQPFEYKIGGELVRGSGELVPKVVPESHRLPVGTQQVEVYKIEQVLDEITAPVRQIRRVELGYRDAKRAAAELKAPAFFPEAPPADAVPPGGPGAPLGGAIPPVMMPMGRPFEGIDGQGGAGAAGRVGTVEQVLLGNKKRYLERTEQVRRMPVGLDLVVDQDFVNDVLIALANSPLRFQATQTQWQRFRDPLPAASASGGSETEPDPRLPIGGGQPFSPMSGPGLSTGVLPSSQVTAGLVELAVYGIVSLYEKADKPKPVDPAKTAELKTEAKPESPAIPGAPQTLPPK